MNNRITAVIIVIVLAIGGFLLFKNKGVAPTEIEINNNMPVPGSEVEEEKVVTETVVNKPASIKQFRVSAGSFSFTPSTIVVDKGDTVEITVKNIGGTHNLKIDEFNVVFPLLGPGDEQTITFVADKAGTFEYYCSVGNHRAQGMVGALIVR